MVPFFVPGQNFTRKERRQTCCCQVVLPRNNENPLSFVGLTPLFPSVQTEQTLKDGGPACIHKHINQRGPGALRGVSGPPPCFSCLTLSLFQQSRGRRRTRRRKPGERAGARQESPASYLPAAHLISETSSGFHFPSSSAQLKCTHISVFLS